MGRALIARLTETSDSLYKVIAYDPSAMAQSRLVELGVALRASPAEVAQEAHLIQVVVPADADVEEVCLGPRGVAAGLGEHRPFLLIHSTVLPVTTQRVAEALGGRAVVMDCPVVGVPSVTRAGQAVFLVGGEPQAVQALTPHLLRLGRAVLHMGPLGMGNLAKLVKNLISGAERFVWHEAMRLAEAGGMAPDQLLELMNAVYEPDRFAATLAAWEREGEIPRPASANSWHHKDFRLAAEYGEALGVRMPLSRALTQIAEAMKVPRDAHPAV
jgi:3-hydroxyisobutyrate dehydrogenase-like beta-hydroxyacid dehydrogenase